MRSSASETMDLNSCTWMVRELGEAVSCTLLLEDNSLLVGGWDGRIKYWSDEGDIIWEAQTPNRICLLYTSPSPRDYAASRMPSSA